MTISFYNERGQITGELSGNAVEYEKDGIERIRPIITTPGLPPFPTAKRLWVEGAWWGKPVYVVDGEVVSRPENPAVVSDQKLENVPVPATVIVNGTSYETNESTVELGFNQPGTYTVKVVAWPYLDKEFIIENPA